MRIRLLIACSLIVLAGCQKTPILREKLYIETNRATPTPDLSAECEYLTIWIHGTRLTPRCILNRIFHSPDGLIKASTFDKQYHLRSITDTLSTSDPTRYAPNNLFLFGWPGALGFKERLEAAEQLDMQLRQLVKTYELTHHKKPKIRIITHSHGGNVALNLAHVGKEDPIAIDELILLACPVQEETAPLVKAPCFKEVFVLYSSLDLIQVADPQGIYPHGGNRPLFSQRHFDDQNNITQVKIKLDGRALLHVDFIRINFVSMLPQIIDKMREFHEKIIQNKKLTHQESEHILSIHTHKA